MPPIPFNPSHRSPFKSTISTSQQVRQRNVPVGSSSTVDDRQTSWPPFEVSASQLDPGDWSLLAEGAKNLVLRYTGERRPFVSVGLNGVEERLALRVPKRSRRTPSHPSKEAQDEISSIDWQRKVVQPLLSFSQSTLSDAKELLAPVIQVVGDRKQLKNFLENVASRVEVCRQLDRRKASGIDTREGALNSTYATRDLTAGSKLTFEIKPKCGFLPDKKRLSSSTCPYKARFSRYRMHRVLKKAQSGKRPFDKQEWENLYEPLDLFSHEPSRIQQAVDALLAEWKDGEGNLRVFSEGKPVTTQETPDEAFQTMIRDTLISIMTSDHTQTILSRLLRLQKFFDSRDIEGIVNLWKDNFDTLPFATQARDGREEVRTSSILRPIDLAEYVEAVARFQNGELSKENDDLRQGIVDLLLSAMWKDCSLFISAQPSSEGSQVSFELHLVDLDPKSIDKLEYYKELDDDVVSAFKNWANSIEYG